MIQQGTCYIVGAGTFYDRNFAPGAGDFVIAADGGYATLTVRGTDMDLVVGDFDSMGFRPDHPKVVDLPVEKDDTDTMAAIRLGWDRGYRTFRLYGGTGGRVDQEEIFGPVACVIKFHDEDEVIAMANDSTYGLGGAVWTRDINRAIRVSRGIETGRMWVNTYNAIPEGAPFGGYKASGIGRETHKVILEHYTQMKNIMINLSEAPSGFYPDK